MQLPETQHWLSCEQNQFTSDWLYNMNACFLLPMYEIAQTSCWGSLCFYSVNIYRVSDWWPHLFDSLVQHVITPTSCSSNCRLRTLLFTNSFWSALHSFSMDPTENTSPNSSVIVTWHSYQHELCRENCFPVTLVLRVMKLLPSNGHCLHNHSLATAVSSGFTILAFSRHTTIFSVSRNLTGIYTVILVYYGIFAQGKNAEASRWSHCKYVCC
jgi:hypothetical protein